MFSSCAAGVARAVSNCRIFTNNSGESRGCGYISFKSKVFDVSRCKGGRTLQSQLCGRMTQTRALYFGVVWGCEGDGLPTGHSCSLLPGSRLPPPPCQRCSARHWARPRGMGHEEKPRRPPLRCPLWACNAVWQWWRVVGFRLGGAGGWAVFGAAGVSARPSWPWVGHRLVSRFGHQKRCVPPPCAALLCWGGRNKVCARGGGGGGRFEPRGGVLGKGLS